MTLYRNLYRCEECGIEWEDIWDCSCNDKCPECNSEIAPFRSEAIVHTEEIKTRASLLSMIHQSRAGKKLSEEDQELLAEEIVEWLETNAEPVKGLFNSDRDDGLLAVPLMWTKNDNEEGK